jgi:Fe-S-cluster containining protein
MFVDPLDKEPVKYIELRRDDMASNELCFCGSGKKQKRCHADVHEKSVAANLLSVRSRVDAEIQQVGYSLCHKGCSNCCGDYFNISVVEFFAVLEHLKIGGNTALLTRHIEKAKALSNNLVFPDSNNDKFRIPDYPPCIFVDDTTKECKVYTVRPIICRMYGYVDKTTDCPQILQDINATNNLIVHNGSIDVVTNIDRFAVNIGKLTEPKAHPIVYWFSQLSDEGDLRSKRMQELFCVYSLAPVTEFVRVLLQS